MYSPHQIRFSLGIVFIREVHRGSLDKAGRHLVAALSEYLCVQVHSAEKEFFGGGVVLLKQCISAKGLQRWGQIRRPRPVQFLGYFELSLEGIPGDRGIAA